jgi:ribonuclease Z
MLPIALILIALETMPGSLELVSCWSKAGVGTSIVLEYRGAGKKRPRILLDCGATPNYGEGIRASTVLISHSHLDHVGAIFSHARAHSVICSGSVPTYYVPEQILENVIRAKAAMEALDGDERQSPMNIRSVKPGDEIDLFGNLFARVFRVSHCIGAVGYVIGSRLAPALKEEYRGLGSAEIRELVKKGVSLKTEAGEVLQVGYTGDTSIEGLLVENTTNEDESEGKSALFVEQAFESRLLFCEATFLDDSQKARDLSVKRRHLHIEDIVRVLEERQYAGDDQQLVLMHISGRYSAKGALDHIASALPRNVASQCLVAISSHLDQVRRRDEAWTHLVQENGCLLLSDYISVCDSQEQL